MASLSSLGITDITLSTIFYNSSFYCSSRVELA